MSDNREEVQNEQTEKQEKKQNVKKPKKQKKHKYVGKMVAVLLGAAIVAGGAHQVSYSADNTTKAVTEEQLDNIRNREEISELKKLDELTSSDKVDEIVTVGELAKKYSDAEKIASVKETYSKLIRQTVANAYEIDAEQVSIDEDEKKISLKLASKVTINLYSKDFITDLDSLGPQALALLKGNTMSSEFNTALEDLAKLTEYSEKCANGEVTIDDVRRELKEIYEHIGIFEVAKGETNGRNITLQHPVQPTTENDTDKGRE